MKRFKIGFLALIAVIAMSFTLTSRAKKTILSDGCYDVINLSGFTNPSTTRPSGHTSDDPYDISDVTLTGTDQGSNKLVNSTNEATIQNSCPGIASFCCYLIVGDKVTKIFYQG